MAENLFQPAFGCAQHPKADQNTQHPKEKAIFINLEKIKHLLYVHTLVGV